MSTPNPITGPGEERAEASITRIIRYATGPPPPGAATGASPLTAVLLLNGLTLFAGATLLFVMQPMVGKMILPLLGGTPAVWSTCMVFFQAALLAGYVAVLALPLAVLPLAVNPRLLRGGEANPVLDVLTLLSLSVGLPFLVVSATAPLLQQWFIRTGHPAARDPYFLHAASNLGSMLALLGYPTLVEPLLPGALRAAALALGPVVLALVLYSESAALRVDFAFLTRILDWVGTRGPEWLDASQRLLNRALIYGPPLGLTWLLRRRPLHLGAALAGILLVAGFVDARNSDQIRQSRSFFGVIRVSRDRDDRGYTELRHGTTLHGRQSLEPARRAEPLSYYQRKGPIGQLFAELDGRPGALRMAVIGLGTGTLAAYARPGDRATFYEIDRLVRDVALDPRYFTYAADAGHRGASLRMELGDARIRLDAVRRERPEERYDVILVDAFTSDAIPVHLLTREALRLYFDVLGPRGILALHISNRYLRLEPVVANLAEDGGYARLLQHAAAGDVRGGTEASWALLARHSSDLGALASDPRWTAARLEPEPAVGTWTDDFHNLLSVFKW